MKTIYILRNLLISVVLLTASMTAALAATYDIKELTPQVKAALDARRSRFEQLSGLKSQGKIGENNSGYVQVLSGGDDVGDIVNAENKDRKFIYSAIVEQNGLPSGALTTVEKVFAQVQRDKASAGDSIQDESGSWIKK
jgi:uncharacterized protein YdbL (DUF1318 family)